MQTNWPKLGFLLNPTNIYHSLCFPFTKTLEFIPQSSQKQNFPIFCAPPLGKFGNLHLDFALVCATIESYLQLTEYAFFNTLLNFHV